MNTLSLTGRVLKYHSNFYYVAVGWADGVEVYECHLRGLLKKEGTEVLVGDFVTLEAVDAANRTARIQAVETRSNVLQRPKIANIDRIVIVHPLEEPAFDPHQLDRYLTHAELAGLSAVVCVSKCDLAGSPESIEEKRFEITDLYENRLGYPVLFTSIHREETLRTLFDLLAGQYAVLAGISGAGKSSLLNRLNPELSLRVGEVSDKLARGQHTTRHVELLEIRPGIWIADTPGFSNLKFNYALPEDIEAAYREFAPYRKDCAFSDCLHIDEEDCAVRDNPDAVTSSRYASYVEMIAEAEEYRQQVQKTSKKNEFAPKQLDRKGRKSVQVLRLKEKDREGSRRTRKQEVRSMADSLADETSDSV